MPVETSDYSEPDFIGYFMTKHDVIEARKQHLIFFGVCQSNALTAELKEP